LEEDLQLVRNMTDENKEVREEGWRIFYERYYAVLERKIISSLRNGYMVDKAWDSFLDRIMRNDFENLRKYEGRGSLASWLYQSLAWAMKDVLRKEGKLSAGSVSFEDVQKVIPEDTAKDGHIDEDAVMAKDAGRSSQRRPEPECGPNQGNDLENDLRVAFSQLPDMERWVFSLRHYDVLGFPEDEIRKLAQYINRDAVEVAAMIDDIFLDGDLLSGKRENVMKAEEKAVRDFSRRLAAESERYIELEVEETPAPDNEVKTENKSQSGKKRVPALIKTPYDVISGILQGRNVSTLHGDVRKAKNRLKQFLQEEGYNI